MINEEIVDLKKIIHDLRQPLATIRSFTRLLPQKLDHPEFLKDYQVHVELALDKMESILVNTEAVFHAK